MKIGIYNRFLHTLGGGERYMATIARILAGIGDVEVISQTAVPEETIRARLGIDLSAVGFVTLDDPSIETAERASGKYDFFINASHLDPVRSRAARSALLVHFPSVTTPGLRGWLKREATERVIRPALSVPVLVGGVSHPERCGDRSFWWTNGDGQIEIPAPDCDAPVVLVPLASFRHDGTGPHVRFVSGDEVVEAVDVPPGSDFTVFPVTLRHRRGANFHLSIQSDTFRPPANLNDDRRLGVAVGEITRAGWRGKAYRTLFHKLRPDLGHSIYGRRLERPPGYVTTYDAVWTVSHFVEEWTKRYWAVGSSLINPPVDVDGIKSYGLVPRENLILNVGRFFEGHHNKKHLEMISAFRGMVQNGLSGWELVLVGGVSIDPSHRAYLERVREAARGLPVRIALDISYEELRSFYARSSVYWHATGYGENERRDPAAMEHFGISTVEAMAGGCVPVVIRRAGQRETVIHGETGLHWRTLEELQARTWEVVLNPEFRTRLSEGARARSEQYSEATFEHRLLTLVDTVIRGTTPVPDTMRSGQHS
jgi:glycosyltransferase involved in cell wall biosynthesis